eukprot:CAMPEP_0174906054 /NCGR_PEP_ID=MMETSP0167-20121228/55388_1 /TAXON_ID=38298 /ORGANISM="Rhodella maculata, Strain CCMP736" /LENGTH=205 /DNA_ID=CAMNT_0016149193 /DNA_START=138 /DNA_END=755 /DNA_ORIENTATION=+
MVAPDFFHRRMPLLRRVPSLDLTPVYELQEANNDAILPFVIQRLEEANGPGTRDALVSNLGWGKAEVLGEMQVENPRRRRGREGSREREQEAIHVNMVEVSINLETPKTTPMSTYFENERDCAAPHHAPHKNSPQVVAKKLLRKVLKDFAGLARQALTFNILLACLFLVHEIAVSPENLSGLLWSPGAIVFLITNVMLLIYALRV